ncbi:MAG: hypothetical protein UZ12_BCD005001508 [Bacteroidetes bacterium OLB12]|nr:MAG: hypothetical protein UZ12_BCD005001508 [Bacteroidetes bacterium OLB12]
MRKAGKLKPGDKVKVSFDLVDPDRLELPEEMELCYHKMMLEPNYGINLPWVCSEAWYIILIVPKMWICGLNVPYT